jgi:hypothetical protein
MFINSNSPFSADSIVCNGVRSPFVKPTAAPGTVGFACVQHDACDAG